MGLWLPTASVLIVIPLIRAGDLPLAEHAKIWQCLWRSHCTSPVVRVTTGKQPGDNPIPRQKSLIICFMKEKRYTHICVCKLVYTGASENFRSAGFKLQNSCKIRSLKQTQQNSSNYLQDKWSSHCKPPLWLYWGREKSTVQLKSFLLEHHWLLLRAMRQITICVLLSISAVLPISSSFAQISLGEDLLPAVWWEAENTWIEASRYSQSCCFSYYFNLHIMHIQIPPCVSWQATTFLARCKAV